MARTGRVDALRKPNNRTRVSNGVELLSGVDGRSVWVRRCRDLISAHTADLGGQSNTSEAERSIIRRAAVMTVELEVLERKFAVSERGAAPSDLDLYSRVTGNLRRLFEAIGLQRRPHDITPTLAQYLAGKQPDSGAAVDDVEDLEEVEA